MFNMLYFRSNYFLQPDSPIKGTKWQKISSAWKQLLQEILASSHPLNTTLHVGMQTHHAVFSALSTLLWWGATPGLVCPGGFCSAPCMQLPEEILGPSCTQLMTLADVCKAIMEFRVPITHILLELWSDSCTSTEAKLNSVLWKFSLRLRHGFRLCHCNLSQFQDGNLDPGKALGPWVLPGCEIP